MSGDGAGQGPDLLGRVNMSIPCFGGKKKKLRSMNVLDHASKSQG